MVETVTGPGSHGSQDSATGEDPAWREKLSMKPLCIDLFCGLGGWTDGFLAEGYDCIGFDIERHDYDSGGYPGQLVLQDVRTLHGSQFANAAVIVASPPCQAYSWMAMPWSEAKREIRWQQWQRSSQFSPGFTLNDLFDACFRIQLEASQAAGHHIPMVIENVKGAQPWVGPARGHFGSYYLWGDVESVGGRLCSPRATFGQTIRPLRRGTKNGLTYGANPVRGEGVDGNGLQTVGHVNIRDGHSHTRHLTNQRESDAIKHGGDCFSDPTWPGKVGGVKQPGLSGKAWFDVGASQKSSKSDSRKAASAQIAKIPLPLSRWVAQVYYPHADARQLEA